MSGIDTLRFANATRCRDHLTFSTQESTLPSSATRSAWRETKTPSGPRKASCWVIRSSRKAWPVTIRQSHSVNKRPGAFACGKLGGLWSPAFIKAVADRYRPERPVLLRARITQSVLAGSQLLLHSTEHVIGCSFYAGGPHPITKALLKPSDRVTCVASETKSKGFELVENRSHSRNRTAPLGID